MTEKEIQQELTKIHKEYSNTNKNKRKMNVHEKIVAYAKLANQCEELLNKRNDDKLKNKIEIEYKNCLLELNKYLFEIGDYKQCIKFDRVIVKIDKNCIECYGRLFESYCKIGENDNGVIFGQMFKALCRKNNLEQQYKDLLYKIDEETEFVAKNFSKTSPLKNFKMTPARWAKLICFFISLIILIKGYLSGDIKWFNKKKNKVI